MITIPLEGGAVNAHQSFSINLGDNNCDFIVNYNTQAQGWFVDISVDSVPKITGMALVANCEISKSYNSDIGRFFFITTDNTDVTLDNLGKSNQLLWESSDGE